MRTATITRPLALIVVMTGLAGDGSIAPVQAADEYDLAERPLYIRTSGSVEACSASFPDTASTTGGALEVGPEAALDHLDDRRLMTDKLIGGDERQCDNGACESTETIARTIAVEQQPANSSEDELTVTADASPVVINEDRQYARIEIEDGATLAVEDGATLNAADAIRVRPGGHLVFRDLATDAIVEAFAGTIHVEAGASLDIATGTLHLVADTFRADDDANINCDLNDGGCDDNGGELVVVTRDTADGNWSTTLEGAHARGWFYSDGGVDLTGGAHVTGRVTGHRLRIAGQGTILSEPRGGGTPSFGALCPSSCRALGGSASSVATHSALSDAAIFQATFDAEDWSGNIKRIPVDRQNAGNGDTFDTTGEVDWHARDTVDAMHWNLDRNIVTYSPVQERGVAFRWDEIDARQQAWLSDDPDQPGLQVADPGRDRLEWVRGRAPKGNDFRRREQTVLGDVVHGRPVYVGRPAYGYPIQFGTSGIEASTPYPAFTRTHDDRRPMLYAAGNDGMLHAIDAKTGEEAFAYVPDGVYDELAPLSEPGYRHRYSADGAPTYGDAFFSDTDGNWHSTLVGVLGAGGQGAYALDITDPGRFSEVNADELVLWEFGDRDYDDDDAVEGHPQMGYPTGPASIVRLHNGEWAALIGNGYNSTEPDGSSGNGDAVLFIVDIETGELIRRITTGHGPPEDPKANSERPNGLSSPAPVDINGDEIVDYVYAGDLFGNVWKFDLRSATSSEWSLTAGDGEPLATVVDPGGAPQPITTRPTVNLHPGNRSGVMLYFGTGRYAVTGDHSRTGQPTQSFYGLWDRMEATAPAYSRGQDLLRQENLAETPITRSSEGERTSQKVRVTSDNEINWDQHAGWVFDLVDPDGGGNRGERVITDAIVRNGRVIFTTLIPGLRECGRAGNAGWLMELDAADGSRLGRPPLDLDGDGDFDNADRVEHGDGQVAPGGLKSKVGSAGEPAIMRASKNTETKFMSGSSGDIDAVTESPGTVEEGRRSWRELK